MSTEIEQLFGGANAKEQNALLHVIKSRGYDFLEKTPVTTMTVRWLEDLNKLGYKLVKNDDLLHDVSESFNSDLRNKFFKECTDPSPNSGKDAGIRKVNMTAHDLFEWFKSNVR